MVIEKESVRKSIENQWRWHCSGLPSVGGKFYDRAALTLLAKSGPNDIATVIDVPMVGLRGGGEWHCGGMAVPGAWIRGRVSC
ncbi:hypothetical protein RR46_04648 [Papilio xuthus]|uniref:Uncharacterized protein n=1 Tax=Papilio xuthus TaxID=66420 RepID=A0A194Q5K3_PAPXU|nr:hypothetical protein RR46_04648 [Papilio xuthus]